MSFTAVRSLKPTFSTTHEIKGEKVHVNLTESTSAFSKTILHGSSINVTKKSTSSQKRQNEGLLVNSTIPHLNFPERNISDLRYHLDGIKKIMESFVKELARVRREVKSKDLKWMNTQGLPLVVNGYGEGYFQKVSHPQIKTLIVNVKKDKISKHLYSQVYNFAGNNCTKMEYRSVFAKSGGFFYGSQCVPKERSINPLPFHDNAFKIGMPGNFTVQQYGYVSLTYIHVIQNAIVNEKGDVFVGNLKIVPQRCRQNLNPTIHEKIDMAVDEEVFTISQLWGNGFFHAIAEDLPRLSPWLDFLTENKNIKIHVHTNNGFLRRILLILGIDPSRMVTGPRRVKVLYMPAGTACGRTAVFNAELLSMQLRNAIAGPVEPRKSIVVIKRSTKRYFNSHNAIFKMIKDAVSGTDINVELFSDEKLPTLDETMAMFNRAFMVIGPHGAGETNLFFSEQGTVVIEGMCILRGQANLCFRNLMRVLGHRFYGVYPVKNCKDTQPKDLEGPLKFYISTLYLNNPRTRSFR